ncbi:hypothetical protein D7V94_06225 [Parablautia intestinalis]|uniref:Uncharacterized protein n=1 Tax=Parablautia intestinalis TaxID=2320100 RepID=A0A3A9ANC4_9FIRM|nr:hypothetical protein [Parablautia intestinalis]RKI92897.1 hypothetical protein D7V94_06225 [Parablautia intestinalis]
MDTDEEYLDDLLESMTNNEQQNRTMNDAMRDVKRISNEVKEITKAADIPEIKSDTVSSDSDDWKASLDDILAQVDMQDETDEPEDDDLAQAKDVTQANDLTQDDLEELIESMDSMEIDTQFEGDGELDEDLANLFKENFDAVNLNSTHADSDFEGDSLKESDSVDIGSDNGRLAGSDTEVGNSADTNSGNVLNMEKKDVTDLIDNMDGADADLAEINGLLKNAERNESVNDDILELLESVRADNSEDGDDSAFDIFDEHELKEVLRDGGQYINSAEELESIPEKPSKKKKRGKKEKKKKEKPENGGGLKKKLFGKKKKAEAADEEELSADTDKEMQGKTSASDNGAADQEDIIRQKEEKKPGFFSKLKGLLEEEEGESSENQDNVGGLKEINEAEREEIKKEAQKKKEKKEKKGNKKEKAASKKPEKKKKAKKVKKEKAPREVVFERPILSKKVLILLVALCATLLASIFILSSLLPDYEQRQRVRSAYQDRDYETVYKFLYNKNRNSNETIMYDRAELIFKLERKWKSYQNNMLLNQELEALHALMEGVAYYHSLSETVEYETQAELDSLYQMICGALGRYGITPEDAMEINAYDDVTYTKQLTSLVNGTGFTAPEEDGAQEEALTPQDILPEEEEIIGVDSDN